MLELTALHAMFTGKKLLDMPPTSSILWTGPPKICHGRPLGHRCEPWMLSAAPAWMLAKSVPGTLGQTVSSADLLLEGSLVQQDIVLLPSGSLFCRISTQCSGSEEGRECLSMRSVATVLPLLPLLSEAKAHRMLAYICWHMLACLPMLPKTVLLRAPATWLQRIRTSWPKEVNWTPCAVLVPSYQSCLLLVLDCRVPECADSTASAASAQPAL